MIILYTVTGIITALFLTIVIVGAIRAHRNPERYGPRQIMGRARQSRAKGIARAMLDTIPIVKFEQHDDGGETSVVKRDVELAAAHSSEDHHETNKTLRVTEQQDRHADSNGDKINDEQQQQQQQQHLNNSADNKNNNITESSNYICPICTDDFVKGQDIRVLPCNHQYHPECVDPWLVNVSGTCPLW